MKFGKLSAIAVAISLTSGCTSMVQSKNFGDLNKQIDKGDLNAALMHSEKLAGEIDPKTGNPDDLLWALQSGALNSTIGNDKRTIMYLDSAETQMRLEDSEGALETAAETSGSIIGNDAMLDYEPTQYDGVMTNYYKAMSFWRQGDISNARIEFNRVEDRQRRAAQYFSEEINEKKAEAESAAGNNRSTVDDATKKINGQLASQMNGSDWASYDGYINPAATYASSLFFMLNGQDGADYNKALDGFKRVYGITRSAAVKQDMNMASDLVRGVDNSKPSVWVIYENGLSPKKAEKRIDLPLFLAGVNRVKYVGMALPVMGEGTKAFPHVQVEQYRTQEIASMSKVIKAEFKEQYPLIVTREVTRATVKAIAQAAAEKNDNGGLASSIMAIASLMTTGADIRSFTMLPDSFDVTRLPKQGKTSLTLKTGVFETPVNIGSADKHTIIYVRALNSVAAPHVSVINM